MPVDAPLRAPEREALRLAALQSYQILDSAPEPDFDDLALLAAQLCQAEAAVVVFFDAGRHWFKACHGLELVQAPRWRALEAALQRQAVLSGSELAADPWPGLPAGMRLCAAAPLSSPQGQLLGALCVLNSVPAALSPAQQRGLAALARQTLAQLELRLRGRPPQASPDRQPEWPLHADEPSFRLLFYNNPLPMWLYDPQTLAFLEVNEAAIAHYGYSRQEFLRMRITDIRPPEDVPRLKQYHAQHLAPLHRPGHWRHRLKDGRIIHVDLFGHVLTFAGRQAVLIAVHDITERKQVEASLKASEERLAGVIENNADAIAILDNSGRIELANAACERILGLAREQIIGRSYDDAAWALTTPEGAALPAEQLPFHQVLRAGQPIYGIELAVGRPDGSRVILSVNAAPLRDPGGASAGVITSMTDITERKRSEALLNGQKRLLELIARGIDTQQILDEIVRFIEQHSSGVICSILQTDEHSQRLQHCAAPNLPTSYVEAINGLRPGPQAGSCGSAAFSAETVIVGDIASDPRWQSYRELALAHGLRACWSTPIKGTNRAVLGLFAMYYDQPRFPTPDEVQLVEIATHIAGIAIERRRAEQERLRLLEHAEAERLRSINIVESITNGFLALDRQWTITYVNREAARLVRKALDEILGQNLWQLFPESRETIVYQEYQRAVSQQVTVEFEIFYPPLGAWFEVHAYPSPEGLSVYFLDISRRKQAEESLRRSEERFRSTFEHVASGMTIVSVDGRFLEVNPAFCRFLGYSEAELLQHNVEDVTFPDDRATTRAHFEAARAGRLKTVKLEKRYLHKSGSIVWAYTTAVWVSDDTGRAAYCVGVIQDITEQKHMAEELQQAQRRLAEIREGERLRLARDLHDTVVQQLIAITYQLAATRRALQAEPPAQSSLELAATLQQIQQAVLDVVSQQRRVIADLRPAGLEEFGLSTALEGFVAQVERQQGEQMPEVVLNLDDTGTTLPRGVAFCLFRSAQEAIRNVVKHAGARHMTVALRVYPDQAVLSVSDDGRGFELPSRLSELAQQDHFGLIGVSEHVAWVEGQVQIRSQPGRGTQITIRTPLPRKEEHG